MKQTQAYHLLVRGLASRRSDLLKDSVGKQLFFPPLGSFWQPSRSDLARCDAFILFSVAEFEHYFESVISSSLNFYLGIYQVYFLRHCEAGREYVDKLNKKIAELQRNNNANWKKISHFFEFVGMKKDSHFPDDYWDDIESIVSHRGHVAHNGTSVSVSQDRREIIRKIEVAMRRTRYFDEHYQSWCKMIESEALRLTAVNFEFSPPKASIA